MGPCFSHSELDDVQPFIGLVRYQIDVRALQMSRVGMDHISDHQ